MTTPGMVQRGGVVLLACALAVAVLGGCSTPKVDWQARVGTYTYDLAVRESGPPEHYAKLTDGAIVAEWLLERGISHGYATGMGYGSYYSAPTTQYYVTTPASNYYLRLTFAPDGTLTEWKKVWK